MTALCDGLTDTASPSLNKLVLDLNLGGHDMQTLFQRFTKYGEKKLVADFQTNRKHQAWDYFGRDGQRGHSPLRSVLGGNPER